MNFTIHASSLKLFGVDGFLCTSMSSEYSMGFYKWEFNTFDDN